MAKAKIPKALKNPQRAAPRVCACSVRTKLDRETGKMSCPGRVRCAPTQKRELPRWSKGTKKTARVPALEQTYKIPGPSVNEKLVMMPPAGSYTTKSDPCKSGRVGCPVQLVFKDNVAHVRFCGASKMVEKKDRKTGETRSVRVGASEMGWIVPVTTPTAARRLVSEACSQWTKAGKQFTDQNIAVIKAKAAKAGVGPEQALGRARRA